MEFIKNVCIPSLSSVGGSCTIVFPFFLTSKTMRKYSALPKFISVEWTEGMAEEKCCQLAKVYAQQSEANTQRPNV
jgi:UDP-N-acetyl-D-mannosaminuronate dehydrogenase